jgi:hypothetical protein
MDEHLSTKLQSLQQRAKPFLQNNSVAPTFASEDPGLEEVINTSDFSHPKGWRRWLPLAKKMLWGLPALVILVILLVVRPKFLYVPSAHLDELPRWSWKRFTALYVILTALFTLLVYLALRRFVWKDRNV